MATKEQYVRNRFSASSGDVALVAAGYTFTIQLPAAPSRNGRVFLESATVYASVAASVTQAFNGAAATATAGTANTIPPNISTPATATIWTTSNVGGGTAAGGIMHLPAGLTANLDLSAVVLNGLGTAANYSITVASLTGTVNITLIWSEKP